MHDAVEEDRCPKVADLLASGLYSTDKGQSGYARVYDELFAVFKDRDIKLLELGIQRGGSMLLWRDYFPHGLVAGLDLRKSDIRDPRILTFTGSQEDLTLLDRIGLEVAPDGFDIIIDDCSHIGTLTEISFWHLFANHLKPGGLFVIEDWGTGYMPHWPDGATYRAPRQSRRARAIKRLPTFLRRIAWWSAGTEHLRSHDAGMVGFVKRLVDECGRGERETGAASAFERLLVYPGIAVVTKAATR